MFLKQYKYNFALASGLENNEAFSATMIVFSDLHVLSLTPKYKGIFTKYRKIQKRCKHLGGLDRNSVKTIKFHQKLHNNSWSSSSLSASTFTWSCPARGLVCVSVGINFKAGRSAGVSEPDTHVSSSPISQ